MPSPATLDFDQLLAPISEEEAAGVDVRSDAQASKLYYAIKDARSSARDKERNSLVDDESRDLSAEWRPVHKQAQELLAKHSKDLEVTAWLVEASVRLEGFAGLRDGFHLARELVEHFWDGIHPRPDEDGLETTVAPLTGLNGEDGEGTLIAPIRGVLITGGQNQGPYATWQYEQALALEQLPSDKRQQRVSEGAATLTLLQQSATETSAQEFILVNEDLEAAMEEFKLLTAKLDELCDRQSPPSSNIRAALQSCKEALEFLAGDKLHSTTDVDGSSDMSSESDDSPDAPATAAPAETGIQKQVRNREDAFKALTEIAEFFRRTEPHSPVSYGLEQVVRWGRTPLPELLQDLISDGNARYEYFRLTGIPNQE